MKYRYLFFLLMLVSCSKTDAPNLDQKFDMESFADIRVEVSMEEWNKLLFAFDDNYYGEETVKCNIRYARYGDTTYAENAGIRLRGNSSKARPEGVTGQPHQIDRSDWHHTHFLINAEKFQKGASFDGMQKLSLKFFHQDPTYVREVYGYDLYRRFGVWTAIHDSYCRLTIKVNEDSEDAYFGVYGMCETVDKDYLRIRADKFGDSGGNLWKCYLGAGMEKNTSRNDMGLEINSHDRKLYELKTNTGNLEEAKDQFMEFINNLNTKTGDAFAEWIKEITDVDLLLRTYAVTYMIGHWDDYWGNANNYYVYFNSQGKFFMIPYDLDNILGTALYTGDTGKLDFMKWGSSRRTLYSKILQIPEYKQKCIEYIHELADSNNDLFDYNHSMARIAKWHEMVQPFVMNDVGENTRIYDAGAPWGVCKWYKVYTDSPDNFFKVKLANLPDLQ